MQNLEVFQNVLSMKIYSYIIIIGKSENVYTIKFLLFYILERVHSTVFMMFLYTHTCIWEECIFYNIKDNYAVRVKGHSDKLGLSAKLKIT